MDSQPMFELAVAVFADDGVPPSGGGGHVATRETQDLGITAVVASSIVEGDIAESFLAEMIAGNPTYAGIHGTANASPFVVDLALLDTVSQHVGTKFRLKASGAEASTRTLAGKPVHVTTGFMGHYEAGKAWKPVGVMLGGKVVTSAAGAQVVRVAGLLWEQDFPTEVAQIRASRALLGASWEIQFQKAKATKGEDGVVEVAEWNYTGSAILLKNAAAFPDTALLHASEDSDADEKKDKKKPWAKPWEKDKKEDADAAVISTEKRNELPDSDFAYVKKEGERTERKLPIHDEAHRKNAWARVNQEGTDLTAAERAAARKKILSRAKREGDAWAKNRQEARAMAGKFSMYSLPEGTDESVIAQIVKDAITELQAGKEIEELKAQAKQHAEALKAQAEKHEAELAESKKTATEEATKLKEIEARATAAEISLAELTTQHAELKAAADTLEAEKKAAELKVRADAWWKEYAAKNGLTALAQAEVEKRRPLIEKAALDLDMKASEWAALGAGARPGQTVSRHQPEIPDPFVPPLMAGDLDTDSAMADKGTLFGLLPALQRAHEGRPTIR
jgi:hypothetical protein